MRFFSFPVIACRLALAAVLAIALAQSVVATGTDDFAGRPSLLTASDASWAENSQATLPENGVQAAAYPAMLSPGGYGDSGGAYGDPITESLCPACDECPRHGYYGFVGYDTWKGITEAGWAVTGLHTGANFGTRLGRFSDWTGIGFQLGGSVGVYNFNGTDYHNSRTDQATMQGFVTGGFFRKPTEDSPWCLGIVQDWMITSNYGIFAENPTLGQWRGQLGYALGPWYEMGIWAAWRGQGDTREVSGDEITWRPVNQYNFYTRYKWGLDGADTWLWIGMPEEDRLTGNGSLGDYTVGMLANAPLSDRVMLYALVSYMHPSAAPGPAGAPEEAWCFMVGLSFYPGRNAKSRTVADQCWMPLMPVANNGTFLADVSRMW